jgi:formylmethanofuran dehydrogenase subunit D
MPATSQRTEGLFMKVILVTGRTIEQGVAKEHGKASDDYFQSVAAAYVDRDDLQHLNIQEKSNVRVSTTFGSVVVKAHTSMRGAHAGIVFIPYGPWANAVVDPGTDSNGTPSLKGIPAEIKSAKDETVSDLNGLLAKQFGKR